MKDLIKTVNGLPLIVKLLLCIPVVEIFYGICRVVNQLANKNIILLIVAILTIIPGAVFMWVIDVVCVLLYGHAFLLG